MEMNKEKTIEDAQRYYELKLEHNTLLGNAAVFHVGGKTLTSYKADVNTDSKFTPDTEVIKTEGGVTYFAESEYRSAPYFDIDIDGITVRTEKK